MNTFKKTAVIAATAAVALTGLVVSEMPASAQAAAEHIQKQYHPLTVRRRRVPAAVVAVPAPAPAPGIIGGPVGVAGTIVGAPFTVLNTIFPPPGGRSGGVTAVRYANAGAEEAKIDEGFAQPVPVDKSGPIFVVQNGDPTVSPLTFIGAPIAAIGSLTQVPFKILGSVGAGTGL